MDDRGIQDALGLDSVDDAVGPDEQFADIRLVGLFGDATAEAGKVRERLCGANEPGDETFGVEPGVSGDVVVKRREIGGSDQSILTRCGSAS